MTGTVVDNSRKSPSWQASSDSMASSLGTPYKRNAIKETIKTQGVDIPRIGFVTFRMPDGEAQPVVESAIALSFRHIDTAVIYENATAVGAAIAALGQSLRHGRKRRHGDFSLAVGDLPPSALHAACDSPRCDLDLDPVLRAARQRYEQGAGDFLNVTASESQLLQSENTLATSDTEIATDLVALYRALGGGWQVADTGAVQRAGR